MTINKWFSLVIGTSRRRSRVKSKESDEGSAETMLTRSKFDSDKKSEKSDVEVKSEPKEEEHNSDVEDLSGDEKPLRIALMSDEDKQPGVSPPKQKDGHSKGKPEETIKDSGDRTQEVTSKNILSAIKTETDDKEAPSVKVAISEETRQKKLGTTAKAKKEKESVKEEKPETKTAPVRQEPPEMEVDDETADKEAAASVAKVKREQKPDVASGLDKEKTAKEEKGEEDVMVEKLKKKKRERREREKEVTEKVKGGRYLAYCNHHSCRYM